MPYFYWSGQTPELSATHGIPFHKMANPEFLVPCCEYRQYACRRATSQFPARLLSIFRCQVLRRTTVHRAISNWLLSRRPSVLHLPRQSPRSRHYLHLARQMPPPPVSVDPLWATWARTYGFPTWQPEARQHLLLHSQSPAKKSRKRIAKPVAHCSDSDFQSHSAPPPSRRCPVEDQHLSFRPIGQQTFRRR